MLASCCGPVSLPLSPTPHIQAQPTHHPPPAPSQRINLNDHSLQTHHAKGCISASLVDKENSSAHHNNAATSKHPTPKRHSKPSPVPSLSLHMLPSNLPNSFASHASPHRPASRRLVSDDDPVRESTPESMNGSYVEVVHSPFGQTASRIASASPCAPRFDGVTPKPHTPSTTISTWAPHQL